MGKRKIKYGIVGAGLVAEFHAEALVHTDNSELAAICDVDPVRAEKFAEKFNCAAFTDSEKFYASGIDVVAVAVPSGLHRDVAVGAARAGKHVICEKPLETTVGKCREIIAACAEHRVLLGAILPSRYSEAAEFIREAVMAKRFGTPVLASAQVRWYRKPEYYAGSSWRGTWALDGGGALMNQGIHTIDLLRFFNGEVERVYASAIRRLHLGIEVEDTVCAQLRFANGSLGSFEASTACSPGFPRRLELSGTTGSVVLEEGRITRWDFAEARPEDEEIRRFFAEREQHPGGAVAPESMSWEGHRRQFIEFSEAIADKTALKTPGEEGLRTVALVRAVYDSASSGRPVAPEAC